MAGHRAFSCSALFLLNTSHGSAAPPAAAQEASANTKIGRNNRSLQTTCTAEEGFTVISKTFPEMEGCFEAQEVIPTGRPGLPVMQYESEAAWFHVEFDLYFGYRWYANYFVGELDSYGVGESSVTVCRTNEDIGYDIQPADETLTYECDLDGDGIRETSPATATMLSFSCGCDGEPSSPPAPTTATPSATPDSIDVTGPPAGAPPTSTVAPSSTPTTPSPSATPDSTDGTSPPSAVPPPTGASAPSGATGAPSASGDFSFSVAPTTTAAHTAAPTAAPTGSPTFSVVATTAPVLLDEAAPGSTSTSGASSVCAGGGLMTLVATIGGVLAVVAGARR